MNFFLFLQKSFKLKFFLSFFIFPSTFLIYSSSTSVLVGSFAYYVWYSREEWGSDSQDKWGVMFLLYENLMWWGCGRGRKSKNMVCSWDSCDIAASMVIETHKLVFILQQLLHDSLMCRQKFMLTPELLNHCFTTP